ncbi:hypothetical protein JOS77_22775 [Chromobacterium haemolyticum]|nr:hypothetical protein JOS77_22775 [Chromobacterium haemolyticum]
MVSDGRLREWPDAAGAYAQLFSPPAVAAATEPPSTVGEAPAPSGAERQLERLYQLEALLSADLARKPKHQKPQLQQQWRREMGALERELGL